MQFPMATVKKNALYTLMANLFQILKQFVMFFVKML
jgi:hypothetical protein